MNIKSGNLKVFELPPPVNKYPWHLLNKKNDYFEWPKKEDAQRIRSASKNQNYKVSVRTKENVLYVIRIS